MDPVTSDLVLSYRTVLSPFVMMTSCATLVWSLQNRYSRVVDSIRRLSAAWQSEGEGTGRVVLVRQILALQSRARRLRNGVVGYYLAMGCFLLTGVLLLLALHLHWSLPWGVVALFLAGLVLVCWTLLDVSLDTMTSFDAVAEEVRR